MQVWWAAFCSGASTSLMVCTVCGCNQPKTLSRGPLVTLSSAHIDGAIEFYGSGEIISDLSYDFGEAFGAGRLQRVYMLRIDDDEVLGLAKTLRAMTELPVPAAPPNSIPGDTNTTIRLLTGGRVVGEWRIHFLVVETHPLWQGLVEECKTVARHNLVSAVFHRDIAEAYAKLDAPRQACTAYRVALERLVKWRERESLLNLGAYIDDAELALTKPLSLILGKQYEKAVPVCRESYAALTERIHLDEEDERRIRVTVDWPRGTG